MTNVFEVVVFQAQNMYVDNIFSRSLKKIFSTEKVAQLKAEWCDLDDDRWYSVWSAVMNTGSRSDPL